MFLGLLIDALPWWIAVPLLQLGLIVTGMALDETYVNRTTVLTGSLAVYVGVVASDGAGLLVGLYLDVGLVIGAYGLYAYVVDAYVPQWFRVAAFFFYSPLSVFLVVLLPAVVFPFAIAIGLAGNVQLLRYLEPRRPYYFGPGSPEAAVEARVADDGAPRTDGTTAERDSTATGSPATDSPATGPTDAPGVGAATGTASQDHESPSPDPESPAGGPTPAGGEPTERGILPGFMRRI